MTKLPVTRLVGFSFRIPVVALVLAMSACSVSPDFYSEIINVGSEVTYLQMGGGGVVFVLDEEIDGVWRTLSPSADELCLRRCGTLDEVGCRPSPLWAGRVYGLTPGDQSGILWHHRQWLWPDEEANCARPTSLQGSLRATVTHGSTAITLDGEPIPEPAESGPLDALDASLADPSTETFAVDFSDGDQIEIEIDD
jgi:hypothetical protein